MQVEYCIFNKNDYFVKKICTKYFKSRQGDETLEFFL